MKPILPVMLYLTPVTWNKLTSANRKQENQKRNTCCFRVSILHFLMHVEPMLLH